MDITDKWVHFDDTLELEIFLTECEASGINWYEEEDNIVNVFAPRHFLKVEMNRFKRDDKSLEHLCGYYCDGVELFIVFFGDRCAKIWCEDLAIPVDSSERFHI